MHYLFSLAGLVYCCALASLSSPAHAQWAVYDHEANLKLEQINNTRELGGDKANLGGSFKAYTENDDLKLKLLDEDFFALEKGGFESEEELKKFIKTKPTCGDKKANEQLYEACIGLRNMRLNTLRQAKVIFDNVKERRSQIKTLIEDSRGVNDSAGQLARYQFELQGLQALMQTDAMQLQVLMDGYKQREKMYETQQQEARNAQIGAGDDEKAADAKAPVFNPLGLF
ncbi:hypothetical protein NBRC116584_06740 [Hydrogenophaga sp. 5NK40-0174]